MNKKLEDKLNEWYEKIQDFVLAQCVPKVCASTLHVFLSVEY